MCTIYQIEQYFPKGTGITRPPGGLVIWVELPEHINLVQLQETALDQGISIAPCEVFSAKGDYKNYIRISYCNMRDKKTERALMKLGLLRQSWPGVEPGNLRIVKAESWLLSFYCRFIYQKH